MAGGHVILDIMVDGVHKGQLKYDRRGFPKMVGGRLVEVYSQKDLVKFVVEKRPSLKGKNLQVFLTTQRLLK